MKSAGHKDALTQAQADEVAQLLGMLSPFFRQIEEADRVLTAMELQLAGQGSIAGVATDLPDFKVRLAEMVETMDRIRETAAAAGVTLEATSPKF